MVITLVIDIFGDPNNGTTVTAIRTANYLYQLGNEVRIIGWLPDKVKNSDYPNFKILRCKKYKLPLVDPLVVKNGFTFSNMDEKSIADFIQGSDVVHLMFPFSLERRVRRVAKVMGIPVTSAYHLQPDSISYNINMGHFKPLNDYIYNLFSRMLYRYTRTVHTPSDNMKNLLESHHYRNDIHAISNGVSSRFVPCHVEKPEEFKDKFIVLMVGRLSGEKRQDLIIKAIGKSKYNDKIQLILCGQGPKKEYLEKLAKRHLKNPAVFRFCNQDELYQVINYSDLYVHASDIESEAIAAIEAFSCGIVPVISDSKLSATNHFALDKRCLFKAGKPESLRDQIDYFIEHPEAREELSPKYVEYGKTFEIMSKAKALEDMMALEIKRDQEDKSLDRTYYSSAKERRQLRRTAKKIGIQNPVIYKKDVYHSKKK